MRSIAPFHRLTRQRERILFVFTGFKVCAVPISEILLLIFVDFHARLSLKKNN